MCGAQERPLRRRSSTPTPTLTLSFSLSVSVSLCLSLSLNPLFSPPLSLSPSLSLDHVRRTAMAGELSSFVQHERPVAQCTTRTKLRFDYFIKTRAHELQLVGSVEVLLTTLFTRTSTVCVLPLRSGQTFPFVVRTQSGPEASNLGRTYVLRALSRRKRDAWMRLLSDMVSKSLQASARRARKDVAEELSGVGRCCFEIARFQSVLLALHQDERLQMILNFFIIASFLSAVVSWELAALAHGAQGNTFDTLEIVFVSIFSLELALAFAANFAQAFLRCVGAFFTSAVNP